jgi:aspartyl-tRNA(Asn)/glutamyl-tRNA(Gln) amidotransferase subunit A
MQDEPTDRDAVLTLAGMAGLNLPVAYVDELVDAYTHIRALVAKLPQLRPYSDEPAHVFDPAKFTVPAP